MSFIAFEGLDGSGKSTLIQNLVQELENRGIEHIVTREPGGTELGETLRKLVLHTHGESAPTARTELLLYEASRAQHVDQLIRPRLEKKHWVISDRYSSSSVAFQEGGRGIPREKVDWLNDFATDNLYPDLWVLIDLTPEESAKRMSGREDQLDRIEQEKQDFHSRVRESYLRQAQESPEHWLVLNGADTPEDLKNQLLSELQKRGWL